MGRYKFRLWDIENKKFLEDDLDTEYFINTYGTVCKIEEYDFGGYEKEISVSSLDNIEISQYTGLKDSENNEIYEYDIVWNEYDEEYQVVIFYEGEYRLISERHIQSLCNNVFYIEVRGNVYENPNLVEEWYIVEE